MKIRNIWLAISGVLFLFFQFAVFVIAGIEGHDTTFWLSYGIASIMLVINIIVLFLFSHKNDINRFVFLNLSLFIWANLITFFQIIITSIFMFLDGYLRVGLLLEISIVVIYSIIVLVCIKNQDVIEEVQMNRVFSIDNMKQIKSELEIILSGCSDELLKREVNDLYEETKYSDSVSSEESQNIEFELLSILRILKETYSENQQEALKLCVQFKAKLKERNIICKNTKKRY